MILADVPTQDQTNVKVNHPTYADIVANDNHSAVTKIHLNSPKNNLNKKQDYTLKNSDGETCQSSDGFIGVRRKHGKTKKLFSTGIAESVNESQIHSYLNQRNIIPTYFNFP